MGLNKAKVLALTQGDPADKSSFSGTNYSLLSRFEKAGCLYRACDVELYGLQKILPALPNFSFDKHKWWYDYMRSNLAFSQRTRNCAKITSSLAGKYNFVLQFGAMFQVNSNVPVASYHDSNIIMSLQGGTFNYSNISKNKLQGFIDREKIIYQKNEVLFTFSDFVKKSFVNDFDIDEQKVHTVYGGANIDIETLSKNERCYDGNSILFIGKEFERKGGKVLLEAFLKLKKEIPDARLVVVGSNPDIKADGVTVTGFIDKSTESGRNEMLKLLCEASLFVMPSFFEPFGIVFAEAMLHRLPCIGTNICAIPEIIDNGRTGLIVEPGDSDALSDAMCTLLKDPEKMRSMGNKGYEKAISTFTWDSVTERMINIISQSTWLRSL